MAHLWQVLQLVGVEAEPVQGGAAADFGRQGAQLVEVQAHLAQFGELPYLRRHAFQVVGMQVQAVQSAQPADGGAQDLQLVLAHIPARFRRFPDSKFGIQNFKSKFCIAKQSALARMACAEHWLHLLAAL